MNADLAVAAHRLDDPTNQTAHYAAQLLARIATTCTTGSDHLSNCGTCPIIDAAHALADHVNGTTP